MSSSGVEDECWMDVKSRLGCELSQFPGHCGRRQNSPDLRHSPDSLLLFLLPLVLSASLAGRCGAEQKAEETLAALRGETRRLPDKHTDPAGLSRARAAATKITDEATAQLWL